VVYATAGYPRPEEGLDALLAVADAGADVIELGIPFSDPLADGPTIQRASFDAVQHGVDLEWCLDLLRRFRERADTPVVLFSYLNPILKFGAARFIEAATELGADGVLLTDLPVDADPEVEALFESLPLDLVRLIAPTTTAERARQIAARSQGFVYYISRTGVTGARAELTAGLAAKVTELKAASERPVAVGFGISTPEMAAAVGGLADGVIVGSAVVDRLGRDGVESARALVAALRLALEGNGPTG
jgi:tryptophan synthase alpha chain